MTDRRERVRALFDEAVDLPREAQAAFLDARCADEPEVRARVEHLLACDARLRDQEGAEGLLDNPLVPPPPRTNWPSTVSPGPGGGAPAGEQQAGEVEAALPGRLGRYELREEIGRGGMGAVLRGHDPDLGRDLAVKVLLPGRQHDPAVVSRFLEEAQIGGQLQHPGVVPVYEMGHSTDQRHYFTMKLVRGRTLAALLRERSNPRQDLPRFEQIFEQVCQTIAFAHSRGVIHRDLKPANIMVGAFGEVQVMDWGLAKVLDRETRISPCLERELTRPFTVIRTDRSEGSGPTSRQGQVMGTLAYMAPEQALGEVDQLDERCDVFGLGAILCEILTGQPPYGGGEDMQVFFMAMRADLAEAMTRLNNCGADAELIRIARSSLAAVAADRPRDAGVLAAEMAAYRESMETRLRQAELAQVEARARAAEERKRRWLTLGLAASMLLTVVVAGGGWLWIAQERAEGERQARELETKLTQEAAAALEQAASLRGQARGEALPGKWAEARAQARRAEALLERLPDRPALSRRVDALLQELNDEEADRRLLARLEGIRLSATGMRTSDGVLDFSGALPAYRSALRDYGVTIEAPPRQVGARIRQRPQDVRARVAAALDDWFVLAPGEGKESAWLTAVLAEAGPDPWRQRLRLARRQRNRAELERLAGEPDLERRPAQSLVMLSQGLLACGAQGQALALLRRAQLQYPSDFWINCVLGWQLGQRPSSRPDGLRYLTAAVALKPNQAELLCLLGIVLGDSGDTEGVLAVFRRATALNPTLAAAQGRLGKLLFEKGDMDGGVAAFERAHAKSTDILNAVKIFAGDRSRKGDRKGAVAAWRRALTLKPDPLFHAEVAVELGREYADRREWRQAAACYARAMKTAPMDNGHFWFEYVALLLLSGDREGYERGCTRMVQLCGKAPHFRAYHAARACTLAPWAVKSAALPAHLVEAELKASRGAAWSLTEQAALHYRAGRFSQALPLLEQSRKLEKRPGRAVLNWLWLALTCHRLGKTEQARSWLQTASKWLDSYPEGMPPRAEQELGLDLHNWLEAHILRREAEALLDAPAKQRK